MTPNATGRKKENKTACQNGISVFMLEAYFCIKGGTPIRNRPTPERLTKGLTCSYLDMEYSLPVSASSLIWQIERVLLQKI